MFSTNLVRVELIRVVYLVSSDTIFLDQLVVDEELEIGLGF